MNSTTLGLLISTFMLGVIAGRWSIEVSMVCGIHSSTLEKFDVVLTPKKEGA